MANKLRVEKLELGAGERRNPDQGWTYQDIQKADGIDVVCDVLEVLQHVEEGCVRQLRAIHMLEHIPTTKQTELFKVLYDLLDNGGRLYIEVPNLQWHAQLIMEGRDEEAVNYAFGGHLDEFDAHMTGFTPKILHRRLELAGFDGISVEPDTSLRATAYKLDKKEK